VRTWCLVTLLVFFGTTTSAQTAGGRELYLNACAACHGADGRGLTAATLGFETPVPDFTDCSFATPEADPDWMAIVHEGGPVRAFDRRMPAFGDALTDGEIQSILDYIRTLCSDPRWPRGELNLPRALVTEKAFPENETVISTEVSRHGGGAVTNVLEYERRIGAQAQIELVVPFTTRQSSRQWNAGLGDVAIALKRALFHSMASGRIVSAGAEAVFPTGKESEGLGGGTAVVEPFVMLGQILPDDAFLHAQAGAELSTGGDREYFWRAAIGKTFVSGAYGRAWSPILEVLADREIGIDAATHWDVLPQMQVSLSKRQHILINGGVRIPLNGRSGRGTQVLTYLLWDWFDGGIRDGWR
jgi:mono/diheme cytochrome c family protein